MVSFKKKCILVYTLILGLPSWSSEVDMIIEEEGKENRPPCFGVSRKVDAPIPNISQITEAVTQIAENIKKAHEKADANNIRRSYKAFEKLEFKSSFWEALGQSLNITKWPSQKTWKEAIGGDLFYPKQIMDWEATYTESYRLERIDTIWTLAISSKFHHPISMYFLGKILDTIHTNATSAQKPGFFDTLCYGARADLEKCPETPDVCYVLGQSYSCVGGISLARSNNHRQSMNYYSKGADLKNQYRVLKLRGIHYKTYTPPSPDEYLSLARTGYPLAYLEAARLLEDNNQKLEVLKEAAGKGYTPSLMKTGQLYEALYDQQSRNSQAVPFLEKAREYYLKAGERRDYKAYIELGKTYVGDIILDESYNFTQNFRALPLEAIEKAIWCFEKAGIAHHPEGWDCLAQLYFNLYQQAEDELKKARDDSFEEWSKKKEFYGDQLYDSLENGVKLGSQFAYHALYRFYPNESFQEICNQYGPAPQDPMFFENIEKFIDFSEL